MDDKLRAAQCYNLKTALSIGVISYSKFKSHIRALNILVCAKFMPSCLCVYASMHSEPGKGLVELKVKCMTMTSLG